MPVIEDDREMTALMEAVREDEPAPDRTSEAARALAEVAQLLGLPWHAHPADVVAAVRGVRDRLHRIASIAMGRDA